MLQNQLQNIPGREYFQGQVILVIVKLNCEASYDLLNISRENTVYATFVLTHAVLFHLFHRKKIRHKYCI